MCLRYDCLFHAQLCHSVEHIRNCVVPNNFKIASIPNIDNIFVGFMILSNMFFILKTKKI
jgi:hypothetical protein